MARQKYRANVLAANFPLLSAMGGKSVVLPQIDQYYMRQNMFSGGELDGKIGIPQVLFMENVMPMANGLSSVGFNQGVPAHPTATDFDQAFWLRDQYENRTLYVPAHGKNYVWRTATQQWESIPYLVSREAVVSVASIKQRTFVCYSNTIAFFEWDGTTLVTLQFKGITASRVNGIVAANAYLVAYTDDTIYWSSILDPTDFLPSLSTTAGSSKVLSIKGKILYCTAVSDGFLIFTTFNTISATYSGNAAFPWTFKEIAGSPGLENVEDVSKETSATNQYANTTSGFIRFDKSQAVIVWPEISEFFNCKKIESFDWTTLSIKTKSLLRPLSHKLAYIADRYVVISYGYGILTHALVFDIGLNRWGKLKIEHVDCFGYVGHPSEGTEVGGKAYEDLIGSYSAQVGSYEDLGGLVVPGVVGEDQRPYKSLAFLKQNGEVFVVDFDFTEEGSESVLYLGKYQLTRNRFIDLYEIWAERMLRSPTSKLAVLSSLNGAAISDTIYPPRSPYDSTDEQQVFLTNLSAHSFMLRLEGTFQLHSLELVISEAGLN